jgi:hypothetical protein
VSSIRKRKPLSSQRKKTSSIQKKKTVIDKKRKKSRVPSNRGLSSIHRRIQRKPQAQQAPIIVKNCHDLPDLEEDSTFISRLYPEITSSGDYSISPEESRLYGDDLKPQMKREQWDDLRDQKFEEVFDFLNAEGKMSYQIELSDYNQVFFTSDLHSDFLKFVQILVTLELIELPDKLTVEEMYDSCRTSQVFTRVAQYSRWIAPKTLLLILGDLVDGARERSRYYFEVVGDTVGNFELLLHVLIYNLRLQAMAQGSFIAFTIGNHDHHAVVMNDGWLTSPDNNYVTHRAKHFYNLRRYVDEEDDELETRLARYPTEDPMVTRQRHLLPFYDLSPYYVLFLRLHNKLHTIAVHGGLHYKDDDSKVQTYPQELLSLQDYYLTHRMSTDAERTQRGICKEMTEWSSTERAPIWTRFYVLGSEEEVCNSVWSLPQQPLVVVGHCATTMSFGGYADKLRESQEGCDGEDGCVLLGCSHDTHGPRLAFVDSAISSVVHPYKYFQQHYKRPVEVLKMSGDNFTKLERVRVPKYA